MAKKQFFSLPEDWKVDHVRKLDFGTFFTLWMPGLALYNLRVVPEGGIYDAFIAVPDDKGKDGNYYKRFFLSLDPEDQAEVIAAVDAALDEEFEKEKKSRQKSRK